MTKRTYLGHDRRWRRVKDDLDCAALVVFSLLVRIAANFLALAFLPRLIIDTGLSRIRYMLCFIEREEDRDRRVFDTAERPLDLGAIL
jgi:hypothetical protein